MGKPKLWVGGDGISRYDGAALRRAQERIRRSGLPVIITFKKSGPWFILEFETRKKFQHLSPPAETRQVFQSGWKYHLSVAHEGNLRDAPDWFLPPDVARIKDTLRYLECRFSSPVWENVPVMDFTPSGTVAVLDPTAPIWEEIEDDLKFTRCLVGRHAGELSVSM